MSDGAIILVAFLVMSFGFMSCEATQRTKQLELQRDIELLQAAREGYEVDR